MAFVPTVLYPLTPAALLEYILTSQSAASPTTLVICSDRETFLQDLTHSLDRQQQVGEGHDNHLKHLLAPTLHNLSLTRHVKLAFCTSVQALLAYLTAYDRPGHVHANESSGQERLVIVNPLALHKPTSSFSAQGLSRTFAAAVDTALRTGAMLHLVECEGRLQSHEVDYDEDSASMHHGESEAQPAEAIEQQDPWDQHVSILNASAKRFGLAAAGERSWAGRTVKAKRIAARWFRFHNLAGPNTNPRINNTTESTPHM